MADPKILCVACRVRPVDPAFRPFCSDRCKMLDLGRWLSEDYRVPDDEPAPDASADGDDDTSFR